MIKSLKTIVFAVIFCALSQSCEKIAMDKDFPLYIQNHSSHSISVCFNDDDNHFAVYPDTSISSNQSGIIEILRGDKKAIAGGSATWESIFEVNVPNDTLSLLVFHTDTLFKYDWGQIRSDYNILKRYDLSLQDLKRLDFTITYPPDTSMKGVKMYPLE